MEVIFHKNGNADITLNSDECCFSKGVQLGSFFEAKNSKIKTIFANKIEIEQFFSK